MNPEFPFHGGNSFRLLFRGDPAESYAPLKLACSDHIRHLPNIGMESELTLVD